MQVGIITKSENGASKNIEFLVLIEKRSLVDTGLLVAWKNQRFENLVKKA